VDTFSAKRETRLRSGGTRFVLLTDQYHTGCNTGFFESRETARYEKNLPTFKNPPQAHARLSGPHENQGGTRGHQRAAREGESAPRGLSERDVSDAETPSPARNGPSGMARGAHVLRRSTEFENVLRSGCRIVSPNFVLRAASNGMAYPRLGIIAGRKSAPRAVDRNRAKRLVREAFRERAPQLGTHDVTIQLRGNLRGDANGAIREELHSLLERFIRRSATPSAK
jgi:ribonuclease P protein component